MWKPICGTCGYYEISDTGEVRSRKSGEWIQLAPIKLSVGYYKVVLRVEKNGVKMSRQAYVHRLVAEAFIPNPYNLPEVNHKNGTKTDNRAENLEWCSHAHNLRHASIIGLTTPGERHACAKLSDAQVAEIKELTDAGTQTFKQIADTFAVSQALVSIISRGYRTQHRLWGVPKRGKLGCMARAH